MDITMKEPLSLILVDGAGNEVVCDVLFDFESAETGKRYIVYTDHSVDEDGNTEAYASICVPTPGGLRFMPIKTEEEWAAIEEIWAALRAGMLGVQE